MGRRGEHRPSPGALRELGRLSGAGVQFAVTVGLCVAVGWWVDGRLGTSPWLLLAGGLVGSVAAFYQLYRALVPRDGSDESEEN